MEQVVNGKRSATIEVSFCPGANVYQELIKFHLANVRLFLAPSDKVFEGDQRNDQQHISSIYRLRRASGTNKDAGAPEWRNVEKRRLSSAKSTGSGCGKRW